MNFSWQNINVSGIFIAFRGSTLTTNYPVSSVTAEPASFGSSAGEKNGLWGLWPCPLYPLRSKDPQGARPFLRGHAHLPGCGNPARALPKLPYGKAGKAGMAGRVPLLQPTICLLCWPALSDFDDSGCSERSTPGLEDSQRVGKAIYAGAIVEGRDTWAEGDWNRRNIYP